MTLSQSSACSFVPFLSRLVLGAAFIAAGVAKLGTTTYEGETLQTLRDMKVLSAATDASAANTPLVQFASWSRDVEPVQDSPPSPGGAGVPTQDPPPGGAGGTGGQDTGQGDTGAGDDADQGSDTQGDAAGGTVPEGTAPAGTTVSDRRLYMVALALKGTPGEKYAKWMAWAVALTELVGGVLVLLGLFTRLGALGLTCVMIGAIYLVGIPILQAVGFNIFELAASDDPANFNPELAALHNPNPSGTLFIQLAFLVMAFGLVLTGGGALSADRFLFKGGDEEVVVKDVD